MEQFKEEIFSNETGHKLIYESASNDDLAKLTNQLDRKYGIKTNSNFFVEAKEVLISDKVYNHEIGGGDLGVFICDKYPNEETVFLIWNYPNQIDKFELKYLVENWEFIWYAESDEVVGVYLPKSGNMLLVTHYDTIYF